jgi:hypothetical protein
VNDTIDAEVASYAAAVRAAFADLPGPQRELLLEDLEDHLAEVAAEAGGPLAERLGRPEAYAAELRASAGLPTAGQGHRRRASRRLRDSAAARRLAELAGAASAHPAGRAVAQLLPELRPAWWVVRGYLAVQAASVAASFLFAGGGLSFPVPQLLGSQALGLLAVVAAVAASVALGRRGPAGRPTRALTFAGNLALGLFGLALLAQLGSSEAYADRYHPEAATTYLGPVSGLRADGREINNIFAFDADGKPLRGVYLVDQDGNPVVASNEDAPDLEQGLPLDRDGNEVGHRYPRAQYLVEFTPQGIERRRAPAPEFRPPPGPLRRSPGPGP